MESFGNDKELRKRQFRTIDGGIKREQVNYAAIREDILGPAPQDIGGQTSGQRTAGARQHLRTHGTAEAFEEETPRKKRPRKAPVQQVKRKKKVNQRKTAVNTAKDVAGKFTKLVKNTADKSQKNIKTKVGKHQKTSYKQGVKGAVIGMLAACIVGIAVTAFMPRLYGVISTLLPIFIVSAYLTFGGKRGQSPKAMAIVLISAFVGVLLIGFGSDIFAPMVSQGLSFKRTWHTFAGNIGDFAFWKTSLYQALIPMIFVLLGTAISIPNIFRNPQKRRNPAAHTHAQKTAREHASACRRPSKTSAISAHRYPDTQTYRYADECKEKTL